MKDAKKYKEFLEEFESAMRAALAASPDEQTTARYFPMTYDVSTRKFYKPNEKTKAEVIQER